MLKELSERPFLQKWVIPLYLQNLESAEPLVMALRPHWKDVTSPLVVTLLSNFDWRPRLVGAWMAALRPFPDLQDHIGRLLLRSDVCYAGSGYCLALTVFNTPSARDYLRSYLEYYLSQSDLFFEQGEAMAALGSLDELNGTHDVALFEPAWVKFVANKPHWNHEQIESVFRKRLSTLRSASLELHANPG